MISTHSRLWDHSITSIEQYGLDSDLEMEIQKGKAQTPAKIDHISRARDSLRAYLI